MMNIGLTELQRQLEELGYKSYQLKGFVCFNYIIPHGRFRNQEVEIALEAPQFPLIPPSGPTFKPHLLPITNGGGVHPFGGIHQRNLPTSDWQYWSRPFTNWNNTEKNAKTYLAFLRTLLDFE
ncbi:MAG: hypothetical protein HYV28_05840 [Ignavibacteriales bacterium]|nr:hypothetical protein [Ignavibacteriales bacterium]